MAISILICAFSFSLAGCATIITGPYQKIPVSSEPSGAMVIVDGKDTYTTPATIRLEREHDHTLVFAKEDYSEETVKILHVISGAFCGNVFLGGPVGMCFDALTGAQFKLVPGKVHVDMKRK